MEQSEVSTLPAGYGILEHTDDCWKLMNSLVLYSVLEPSLGLLIIESHVTVDNTFNRCFSFQFQIRCANQQTP